jgi:hypothetical protein
VMLVCRSYIPAPAPAVTGFGGGEFSRDHKISLVHDFMWGSADGFCGIGFSSVLRHPGTTDKTQDFETHASERRGYPPSNGDAQLQKSHHSCDQDGGGAINTHTTISAWFYLLITETDPSTGCDLRFWGYYYMYLRHVFCAGSALCLFQRPKLQVFFCCLLCGAVGGVPLNLKFRHVLIAHRAKKCGGSWAITRGYQQNLLFLL